METIYIEETAKTPFIKFNADLGNLEIKGKSITENAHKFYNPIINDWLEQYAQSPKEETTANIELEYFNTSSSMWILRLFKKLEEMNGSGHKVIVNWLFSDEDIYNAGEDYQELVSIPFNLIEIDS